jgi:hypothetical protein
MHLAEGKAVKVVSALLQYVPSQYTYKIIFMQRPMPEVLASQKVCWSGRVYRATRGRRTLWREIFSTMEMIFVVKNVFAGPDFTPESSIT